VSPQGHHSSSYKLSQIECRLWAFFIYTLEADFGQNFSNFLVNQYMQCIESSYMSLYDCPCNLDNIREDLRHPSILKIFYRSTGLNMSIFSPKKGVELSNLVSFERLNIYLPKCDKISWKTVFIYRPQV